ncbi:MAG: hypothetical protein KBF82_07190 [Chitinophagaceae bacterium]|nr:hypothetical protein [Chitinophagaceae bacterium]MBP9103626.1 hypothetical protein [Chitinophagaceae bacterium]
MNPKEKPKDDQNVNELNSKEETEDISINEQIDQFADVIIDLFLSKENEEE